MGDAVAHPPVAALKDDASSQRVAAHVVDRQAFAFEPDRQRQIEIADAAIEEKLFDLLRLLAAHLNERRISLSRGVVMTRFGCDRKLCCRAGVTIAPAPGQG